MYTKIYWILSTLKTKAKMLMRFAPEESLVHFEITSGMHWGSDSPDAVYDVCVYLAPLVNCLGQA